MASRLRGLVLGAAFAGRIWQGAPQHRLQLPLLRWGILPRWSIRIGGLLGAFIVGDAPSPAEVTVLLEMFLRQDHRAMVRLLDACAEEDTYPRLGEIGVPTVVICGSNDKVTPPRHSQHLAAAIPDAQMVWVPGGGHLLYWEAPDTLIQAVQAFPRCRHSSTRRTAAPATSTSPAGRPRPTTRPRRVQPPGAHQHGCRGVLPLAA